MSNNLNGVNDSGSKKSQKKLSDYTTTQKVVWGSSMVFVATIIALAGVSGDSFISEDEAVVICQSAYKNNAKYQGKIPYSGIKRVSDYNGTWVIKLEGKLQNGFGAWQTVAASCIVNKIPSNTGDNFNSINIKDFRYHQ